jgi:hypothetical protein
MKCSLVLQAEDFLDEILSFESNNSLNDPTKLDTSLKGDLKIKKEPNNLSEAEARDRQKKDNHNMSKTANGNSKIWSRI